MDKKPLPGIKQARGEMLGNVLTVTCSSPMMAGQLLSQEKLAWLGELAREFFGSETEVRVQSLAAAPRRTRADLKEEMKENPVVKSVTEEFQARIMEVRPVTEQGD